MGTQAKKVTKAIFPVVGLGTRFLPATKSVPKEIMALVDRPLVQYAIDEARASGIREFIFITSRGKSALENYFDHGDRAFGTEAAAGLGRKKSTTITTLPFDGSGETAATWALAALGMIDARPFAYAGEGNGDGATDSLRTPLGFADGNDGDGVQVRPGGDAARGYLTCRDNTDVLRTLLGFTDGNDGGGAQVRPGDDAARGHLTCRDNTDVKADSLRTLLGFTDGNDGGGARVNPGDDAARGHLARGNNPDVKADSLRTLLGFTDGNDGGGAQVRPGDDAARGHLAGGDNGGIAGKVAVDEMA